MINYFKRLTEKMRKKYLEGDWENQFNAGVQTI